MKIILLLFLISAVFILFQHFKLSFLLKKFQDSSLDKANPSLPVSIIICAKNEQENLSRNLESVLNQNYPEFEVIVVDDNSSDLTSIVVKNFQEKYNYLKLIQIKDDKSNSKRKALKMGVLETNYDVILLTDADCKPISKHWIQNMQSKLSVPKTCVLGYSPYTSQAGFLNAIIQFETLQTASLYMSRAIDEKAYMSVGRNVMYTKDFFYNNENFDNETELTSGDDDLLIQNEGNKSLIAVNLDPESFVLSQPKTSLTSWWKQKLRHYSTASHYKSSHQLFLGLYHLFHALFWLCFLILLLSEYSEKVLLVFIVTLGLKSYLLLINAKLFKVSNYVLLIWPILEASLLLLQLGLGINGRFKKQKTWQ